MAVDRDAWRRLVGGAGQIGALHADLGVVQRVEVTGRHRRDRLDADLHPGELDDLEHLRDAVVHVAHEPADRGLARPEGELAGRGDLDAHLLLDVGRVDPVAPLEFPGLRVEMVFGHHEHAQSLGTRPGSLGPRQDEVDDVVFQVMLAGRDEPLHAVDVPAPVGLLPGKGAPRAHVGTRVGLGEHHGRPPPALDHELGDGVAARPCRCCGATRRTPARRRT
jgi:hypothetical protein